MAKDPTKDPTKQGTGNPNPPNPSAPLPTEPNTRPNQMDPQLSEPVDQRSPGQADPNVPPFDAKKPHVDPETNEVRPAERDPNAPPAPGMVKIRATETILVRSQSKYAGDEFWATADEVKQLVDDQKKAVRV